MGTPVILVGAILTLGVLYVVLPVVVDTLLRFREARRVECPELKREATIEFDAPHAALTSAVGRPKLRLRSCTFWPEKQGCAQSCLKQVV
jgi:hypothetical protein